jgi:hypothetical protein
MWTKDQLFKNANSLMRHSLSIGHRGSTQSLNMDISRITWVLYRQSPTFGTDCEFALPMSMTPLGVAVPNSEHVELVQRF